MINHTSAAPIGREICHVIFETTVGIETDKVVGETGETRDEICWTYHDRGGGCVEAERANHCRKEVVE
jgi:hypothetical protein